MRRKIFILSACLLTASLLTSCYSTKLYVGNVEPSDPVVKVNKEWNHHVIYGLVPVGKTELKPADYVKNKPDYVVKTNTSFLNYLVSGVTFGLYTPTQTTFYLPLFESEK